MDKVALAIHDAHIQYDKRARDNERSCARLLRVDTLRFVREESDGYGKRTNQRTTVSAHRSCMVGSLRRGPTFAQHYLLLFDVLAHRDAVAARAFVLAPHRG